MKFLRSILFDSILMSVIINVPLAASDAQIKYDSISPSISGNYSLTSNPDIEEYRAYLKAMEYSEESQNIQRKMKPHFVSWAKLNQTHWLVTRVTITPNQTITLIFLPGQEFSGALPDGRMKPHSFTVDEKERIAVKTIRMDGFNATQELRFTKLGFNITMMARNATGILEFLRVPWSDTNGGKHPVQGKWKGNN